MTKTKGPSPAKRCFPDISSRAFEHPLDRSALAALRKVPGIDWVVRKFIASIGERRLRLLFLASAVRVNERQFPALNASFTEACRILDIQEKPELFVAHDFISNAAAIGSDRPFVIVTSSLVEMLDEDELQCVLGHELGHVMCGHALYTTVLLLLMRMWFVFLSVPGGVLAVLAIRMALLEWRRKAELSAERAGLLVCQDLDVAHRVNMKMAGGRRAKEMNLEEFRNQADEYQASGDLLDGVLKLALLMEQTHPFSVLRLADLDRWAKSGEYEAILAGEYPRRGDAGADTWLSDIKAAAVGYKESWDDSQDPFLSSVRDLGGGAAAAGGELLAILKRWAHVAAGGEKDDGSGGPP